MTPAVHRAAAFALLGVVLAAVLGIAVLPVAGAILDLRTENAALAVRIADLGGRQRSIPVLTERLAALEKRASESGAWVAAADDEAARAAVASALRRLEEAHGASHILDEPLAVEREEGLTAVRLAATLQIAAGEMEAFLIGLETTAPVLFVDRLRARRIDDASGGGRIELALELRAFALVAAARKPP